MVSPQVIPLLLADVSFPEWHPRAGQTAPVYGFAVMHASGPLLVDTGLGPPHPEIDAWYRPVRRGLPEALAAAGLDPQDIAAVINTHLHFDHCGGNHLFPGRPIFVQAREYEAAKAPDYTIRELVDFPGADFRLLDGEARLWPGISLMPTPGHTLGHQSVAVQTEQGLVVIAGQAAETAADFASPGHDASQATIRAARPARVYFSHDRAVWPGG